VEEVKVFKRKSGQSEKRREALRFALNESIGDRTMLAEILARPHDPDAKGVSMGGMWERLCRSYVGRFRTKRLRNKHAEYFNAA
jgi:hypothetical protein